MKKNSDNEAQIQQWFDEYLGEPLQKMDSTQETDTPSISEFIAFVESHKREHAKRQWRDLLLFWLAAVPVVGIMLWMLERDWLWFASIQLSVTIGAILYIITKARQRVDQQWNN